MSTEQPPAHYDRNHDLKELHQLCQSEESLINKLDMKEHRGYVTDDQLKAAITDKHLSRAERNTADIMLQTQDDIRYQRLGYLPSPTFAHGGDAPGGRPRPELHSSLVTDKDKVTLADVKLFDRSLNTEASMRKEKGSGFYAEDIMHKYAKAEPDKRLLPSEVWAAVGDLSKKPNLSKDEKQELQILKYTQEQMREMYPKAPAPADRHSAAYRDYDDRLNRIPAKDYNLYCNADAVMRAKFDNTAIMNTYFTLHPQTDSASDGGTGPSPASDPASDQRPNLPPPPGKPQDIFSPVVRPVAGHDAPTVAPPLNEAKPAGKPTGPVHAPYPAAVAAPPSKPLRSPA